MIRKLSLFPEIGGPLGLQPAVLDELGAFPVLIGPNGSGKSRLLGLIRLIHEAAPRTEELRTRLSQELSVAREPAARARIQCSLSFVEALARPEAILVDGPQGLRRPCQQDRWIDLTYGRDTAAEHIAAAFPDLPRSESAVSFAAAHRSASTFLQNIAKAMFYGQHPLAASDPKLGAALRDAERFNRVAHSLLGKAVTPAVSVANGLEITANLGGRRFQPAELSPGEGLLLTWAILLHEHAPSLQSAVVAIDEPELHLHPELQERILSSLLELVGGGGQLWVVTHSPTIAARSDVTNRFLVEHGRVWPVPDWPPSEPEPELGLVVSKPPHILPSPSASKAPLGESDFRAISTSESLIYVDKTEFIEDVLNNPAAVLLFPRPRRFGKSLNLSTLRYFVEKSPESQLRAGWFEGLRVWKNHETRKHFGRYPVIYLNLKVTKAGSFSSLLDLVRNEVSDQFEQHRYLLEGSALSASERAFYEKILRAEGKPEDYPHALKRLSRHLEAYHGERVVILVDEYDTPLNEAYLGGYLDEATRFLGNFFSAGLKDNPHLFKGVLTGILRIARESLFSDLNNLSVYSILRPEFATHFGFTEGEVEDLCQRLGSPELMSGLREWYDGYLFGEALLYNPWSVLSCLSSDDKQLATYWADTSSNKLLRSQLLEKGQGRGHELLTLLRGEPIHKPIEENLVLRSLDTVPDAVWSLLLFAGYLRPADPPGTERRRVSLMLPNLEVRHEIEGLVREVREAFASRMGGENEVETMLNALLRGDRAVFEKYLNQFLTNNMSYYDRHHRVPPEHSYHQFMLGMACTLSRSHESKSNLESGDGRSDLMLCPRDEGQPGVCLEFKVRSGKQDVEALLDEALRQIDEKRYTSWLEDRKADPIHKVAIVFEGKKAWVKLASAT
ncbi:MAG: AAA family ATPase [Deltaproteobacteria bacterium]|nr:AAA family ATPase [Deltaproteobacteria bacterium]